MIEIGGILLIDLYIRYYDIMINYAPYWVFPGHVINLLKYVINNCHLFKKKNMNIVGMANTMISMKYAIFVTRSAPSHLSHP